MTLMIPRPFKHPKTGVYYYRRVVPPDLMAVLGKREIKRTLDTKDVAEAKRRHASVHAEVELQWVNLRAGSHTLTERRAHEIASPLYRRWIEIHAENPSQSDGWLPELFGLMWKGHGRDPEDTDGDIPLDRIVVPGMEYICRKHADWAVEEFGLQLDPLSLHRLAKAISLAIQRAALFLDQIDKGYLDPAKLDRKLEEFEKISFDEQKLSILKGLAPDQGVKTQSDPIRLTELLERWWVEAKSAGRKVSTYRSYGDTIRLFVQFLSYDDASRITVQDIVAYKDHRLRTPTARTGKPPSPKTVKDSDLSALKTVFSWAVSNKILMENPASGITIKLVKPPKLRSKGYTEHEAQALLNASLGVMQNVETPHTAAAKKWIPWLLAFSGARVGEIAQLRRQDIRKEKELWIITITPEAGTVKNNEMRQFVLHHQLIELGFVHFVEQVQTERLFLRPSAQLDISGQRKGLTNRIGEFSRSVIADRGVDPNHGWRHRFKTIGLEAGISHRVLDAIQGHATRLPGESYGDVSLKTIAAAVFSLGHIELIDPMK